MITLMIRSMRVTSSRVASALIPLFGRVRSAGYRCVRWTVPCFAGGGLRCSCGLRLVEATRGRPSAGAALSLAPGRAGPGGDQIISLAACTAASAADRSGEPTMGALPERIRV
jgi:hypothetical protein